MEERVEVDGFVYTFNRRDFIANGSFAQVFRGRRHPIDTASATGAVQPTDVAVKEIEILDETHTTEKDRLQLQREVEINQTLSHGNIVQVYAMAEAVNADRKRVKYFFMELCDTTLAAVLRSRTLTGPEVVEMLRQLCNGLSYLQPQEGRQILHRDIKPPNILVCNVAGRTVYKFGDFGLARQLEGRQDVAQSFAGTPLYAAPEIVDQKYSTAADLFSLGCVLYTALTKHVVHTGATLRAVMEKKRNEKPEAWYENELLRKCVPHQLDSSHRKFFAYVLAGLLKWRADDRIKLPDLCSAVESAGTPVTVQIMDTAKELEEHSVLLFRKYADAGVRSIAALKRAVVNQLGIHDKVLLVRSQGKPLEELPLGRATDPVILINQETIMRGIWPSLDFTEELNYSNVYAESEDGRAQRRMELVRLKEMISVIETRLKMQANAVNQTRELCCFFYDTVVVQHDSLEADRLRCASALQTIAHTASHLEAARAQVQAAGDQQTEQLLDQLIAGANKLTQRGQLLEEEVQRIFERAQGVLDAVAKRMQSPETNVSTARIQDLQPRMQQALQSCDDQIAAVMHGTLTNTDTELDQVKDEIIDFCTQGENVFANTAQIALRIMIGLITDLKCLLGEVTTSRMDGLKQVRQAVAKMEKSIHKFYQDQGRILANVLVNKRGAVVGGEFYETEPEHEAEQQPGVAVDVMPRQEHERELGRMQADFDARVKELALKAREAAREQEEKVVVLQQLLRVEREQASEQASAVSEAASAAQTAALEASLADTKRQLAESESRVKALEQQHQQRNEAHHTAIASLQGEVAKAQAKVHALETKISAQQGNAAAASAKQVEEQIAQLQRELESEHQRAMEAERSRAEATLATACQEAAAAARDELRATLNAELALAKKTATEAQAELKSQFDTELQQARKEAAESTAAELRAEFEAQLEQAKKEAAEAAEARVRAEFNAELKSAGKQAEEIRTAMQGEFTVQLDAAREEAAVARRDAAEARADLDNLSMELEKKLQVVIDRDQQLSGMTAALADQKTKHIALQEEIELMSASLAEKQRELDQRCDASDNHAHLVQRQESAEATIVELQSHLESSEQAFRQQMEEHERELQVQQQQFQIEMLQKDERIRDLEGQVIPDLPLRLDQTEGELRMALQQLFRYHTHVKTLMRALDMDVPTCCVPTEKWGDQCSALEVDFVFECCIQQLQQVDTQTNKYVRIAQNNLQHMDVVLIVPATAKRHKWRVCGTNQMVNQVSVDNLRLQQRQEPFLFAQVVFIEGGDDSVVLEEYETPWVQIPTE